MTESTLLGSWIKRFLLDYLVTERNLSINTRSSYRDMIVLLLHYLSTHLKKSVDRLLITDISAELIRQFLGFIEQKRGCSIATRNQRLGALHALARFIGQSNPEYVEWCSQICLIPFKKTVQPNITYLDKIEMDAVLNSPDRNTPQGQRDYSLLLFLYNSGVRASEAANLGIAEIDWYTSSVHIVGKGNKRRTCPLWSITIKQLKLLIENRDVEQNVFLNRNKKPITRFGIHTLVERHALKAALQCPSLSTKRVSPHVIRHTTASHLLKAGVDINTIRAWLGHVSLNTTYIYAETDLETKAKALATCEPDKKGCRGTAWRDQSDLIAFLQRL